jgi:hypothetical protein
VLVKEKKRAAWSLAFGILGGFVAGGWNYHVAMHEQAQLKALIAQCGELDPSTLTPLATVTSAAEKFVSKHSNGQKFGDIIRDPEFGKFQRGEKAYIIGYFIDHQLKTDPDWGKFNAHDQADLVNRAYKKAGLCDPDELLVSESDASDRTEVARRHAERIAALVFGFFCLPFIWYFLLDRLREISAAVSGRDRNL